MQLRQSRSARRWTRLGAGLLALSLIAAACGDDKKDDSAKPATGGSTSTKTGGEIVDLGTFLGDPPEFLDPALNSTLNAYQVINELYDGLTDVDASDPANPK